MGLFLFKLIKIRLTLRTCIITGPKLLNYPIRFSKEVCFSREFLDVNGGITMQINVLHTNLFKIERSYESKISHRDIVSLGAKTGCQPNFIGRHKRQQFPFQIICYHQLRVQLLHCFQIRAVSCIGRIRRRDERVPSDGIPLPNSS